MTIALWCVLVAGLLPYPFAAAAKWSKRHDNRAPREYFAQATGWRQRAHWVQLNSFEAFPLFAAAVIICHQLRGANPTADWLALAYIGLRLAYGYAYIANQASLRSTIWFASIGCVIGLFVLAA